MSTPCGPDVTYKIFVDWFGTGTVAATGNDVTENVLGGGSWSSSYGRDQARQLSPTSVGTANWTLCNVSRTYSPENPASPLFGFLGPGRETEFHVELDSVDHQLFTGRIDDFNVTVDFSDRNATFTGLDGLGQLRVTDLSTAVFEGLRTGQIVNVILDEAGWDPDLRSIDIGASFTRFWWAEGQNALDALLDVVAAEGPPAIVYVAPDGTFVFRDRHHRLLLPASLVPQATYSAGALGECCPVDGYGQGGYGECGYGE